jgi:hypothetical protein
LATIFSFLFLNRLGHSKPTGKFPFWIYHAQTMECPQPATMKWTRDCGMERQRQDQSLNNPDTPWNKSLRKPEEAPTHGAQLRRNGSLKGEGITPRDNRQGWDHTYSRPGGHSGKGGGKSSVRNCNEGGSSGKGKCESSSSSGQ